MLSASKYGKEFVAAASKLKPDSGVNFDGIAVCVAPSAESKPKLFKEIAQEHELDWDPASKETDLFKSHEDILDGPKHFGGGSKLPLQEEEQDKGIRLTMLPLPRPEDQSDSDESLDFLEVPNVLMRSTPENAPEAVKPATYEHTSLNMPFDS
ncbi:Regulator of Vps4 activity in the MVB pathway protein [Raphanus sativus]|nr:Regulator of Vps4 activity in the MVB pathway protein [Raphanus sativus]